MLKPSMQDLMKRVNNRYLLVNLAAQRARDLSMNEEEMQMEEKPIKIALDEICDDKIEYRSGPRPEPSVDILTTASSEEELTVADEEPLLAEDVPAEDDIAEEL